MDRSGFHDYYSIYEVTPTFDVTLLLGIIEHISLDAGKIKDRLIFFLIKPLLKLLGIDFATGILILTQKR